MAYHHHITLSDFGRSYVRATNAGRVDRAVVFVHGFLGDSYETWMSFQQLLDTPQSDPWWDGSDLYFLGYDSFNQSVAEIAKLLLGLLDKLEPAPAEWFIARPPENPLYAELPATELREQPTTYKELVLVGHSLGGLAIRYAVLQRLLPFKFPSPDKVTASQLLQNAQLRLFAPAINGSRPAGIKAFILHTAGIRAWALAALHQSPSYNDMLPTSRIIGPTRTSTEDLAEDRLKGLPSLTGRVLWGGVETVVQDNQYDCDNENPTRLAGADHVTVCKPRTLDSAPVQMVRYGRV